MRFKSIEIKDYRQYKYTKIIFSDSNINSNLIVIEGANGAGKTNLLNAITWCLYGNEEHLSAKDKGLPIINNITLSNLKPQQSATIEVKLIIQYDEGRTEIFERKMEVTKNKEGNPINSHSDLKVFFKEKRDRDWHISEDPAFRVAKVIPKGIQEYFLFDGERLEKYFSKGGRQGLRKEVFEVSQLNLFNNVIDHLEKMQNEYQKELAQINPKADEIKARLDRKKDGLETEKKKKDDLESKLKEASDQEEQLLEELKGLPLSVEKITELKEKKESYQKRLQSLEQDIEQLRQDKLNYLLDYFKIITGYRRLEETKDMISQKVERGEIPPEYKKGFIERLLEQGVCICGTEIKAGKPMENVNKLLEQCTGLDEISQDLIREDHNLEALLEKAKYFKKGEQRISKNIVDREKDFEIISSQLQDVEKQIFGIDDERVKNIEKRYRIAKKQKENLIDEIGMKKQIIKGLTAEIATLEKEFDNEVRKIEKHEDMKQKLNFTKECNNVGKEIMIGVMEEIRAAIEDKTKDQFLSTIWKKGTYKDVIIDEDYNISVLDQNGMESIGTLSKGESHFLALSFVNALHLVSGFKTPIVIDTPLGRISGEPKLNLAKVLPKFTESKQLILLVTDQEYTPEVRGALKKPIGKEFKIKFVETDIGCKAEVVPYEEKT